MRLPFWPVAVALSACLIVGMRLKPPLDLGTWSTEALSGEVVLALAQDQGAGVVLVGTLRGLHQLHPDGRTNTVGSAGPVRALAVTPDRAWVGTDEGVLSLVDTQLTPSPEELAQTRVHALDADGERLLIASDDGVHELTGDGVTRLWPPQGEPPAPVSAVLAAPSGILLAHHEGLAMLNPDGTTEVVLPGADVVALGRFHATGDLWAGTRGAPLLARSDDGGRTWAPTGEGLGFSAVNALATNPARGSHHVVGGSGLADGSGNAGTQWTRDDAGTWHTEQDRLSNTHVFAMTATQEPVRVSLSLPVTDLSVSIPLPATTSRWYAGTNGSGVATMRPDVPALDALATAAPVLRVIEPLLLGTLLLGVLLPAYRRLARHRTSVRGPPSPSTSATSTTSARDQQ